MNWIHMVQYREDNIKMDLKGTACEGVDWVHMVQYRGDNIKMDLKGMRCEGMDWIHPAQGQRQRGGG